MSEIWKYIAGYERLYSVSNLGNVFSVRRNRLLKPGLNNGYLAVVLSLNGKTKTMKVHTIVAEAFLGDKPHLCVIDHINGDKFDNSVGNLQYITQRENILKGKLSLLKENRTSNFFGVYWRKANQKWATSIGYNGKDVYLLQSEDEKLCAKIYQEAKLAIENNVFEDFRKKLVEIRAKNKSIKPIGAEDGK